MLLVRAIGYLVFYMTIISSVINGIMFVGLLVKFLQQYIGLFAYIAWAPVLPFVSPAAIAWPWIESWVYHEAVRDNNIYIWASWYICILLRIIFAKWAPD